MADDSVVASLAGGAGADSFRRTVSTLLAQGELRGDRLTQLCREVLAHSRDSQWPLEFQWLLFMPRFLNICLIQGSCNGDCRMCSAGRNVPRTHLSAAQYRRILEYIPTADGICLSATDSDPLMNPDLPEILAETGRRGLRCDFFTNGLALTPRLCGDILGSSAVNMINVSLDACTAETYRRIRRRDFGLVQQHVAALQAEKRRRQTDLPWLSISLVAMADNIEELPGLVDYAAAVGALMVYVEYLNGEHAPEDENQPALNNLRCRASVEEAVRRATAHGLTLELPSLLRGSPSRLTAARNDATAGGLMPAGSAATTRAANAPLAVPGQPWPAELLPEPPIAGVPRMPAAGPTCCTWLRGVWVRMDGGLSACCQNHTIDLGRVTDGKLWENPSYLLAKMKLFTGKIHPSCVKYRHNCPYTQALFDRGVRLADYLASV